MRPVPARIGHRYNPRSETVVLRVHPSGATIADEYELLPREARRLAWALLADLVPDDIDEELERSMEAIERVETAAARCTCGRRRAAPRGKSGVILRALSSKPLTARQAGEIIDRDTSTASAFLVRLVADGLAERIGGGGFGEPSLYAISPAGTAVLEPL